MTKKVRDPNCTEKVRKILLNAFMNAKLDYESDNKRRGEVSKIGGKFGIFSVFRHGSRIPSHASKLLHDLQISTDPIDKVIAFFKKHPSSWTNQYFTRMRKANNHDFINYFSHHILKISPKIMRHIIKHAIGIVIYLPETDERNLANFTTLYRKDTRPSDIIFTMGFAARKGWEMINTEIRGRVVYLGTGMTQDNGISTAKSINCSYFSNQDDLEHFYEIRLPVSMLFILLAVDINKSLSANNHMKRKCIEEVNFTGNIEPIYIFRTLSDEVNANFQSDIENEHANDAFYVDERLNLS